jgi:hypothetical protein
MNLYDFSAGECVSKELEEEWITTVTMARNKAVLLRESSR